MPGLTVLLIVLIPLGVPGSELSNEELLHRANDAFRLGVANQARVQQARRHFTDAADLYRQLRERGVRSPALYLNLGNADFLAGSPERAVWAYLCGLQLAPKQRQMHAHLALARSRIQYPPGGRALSEAASWPLLRPTAAATLLFAATAYTLACLLATLWLRRRGALLLAACLASFACTAVGLLTLAWLSSQAKYDQEHPLVVVAKETPLYRGNGTSYPTHPEFPTLPRGLEARQLLRRGSWLQVRFSSGEIGWLPAATTLLVAPPLSEHAASP